MFKDLDPILHSQLRLSIVSILMTVEEANFNFIKEKTNATSGNISIQFKKLSEAGYVKIKNLLGIIIPIHRCQLPGKEGKHSKPMSIV